MKIEQKKIGKLFRSGGIDGGLREVETSNGKTQELTVSISSEEAVERWFGMEVLSHDPRHVNLARLQNGGPFLLNHSQASQIGAFVPGSVEIGSDRKLRGKVRFSRSEKAREIVDDIEDGIRNSTSVGYVVRAFERARDLETNEPKGKDGEPERKWWRAVDWIPLEGSIVPIPADPGVGPNRGFEPVGDEAGERNEASFIDEEDEIETRTEESPDLETRTQVLMRTTTMEQKDKVLTEADLEALRGEASSEGARKEKERQITIRTIGRTLNLKDEIIDKAISDGTTLEAFRVSVTDGWDESKIKTSDMRVGLTEKEKGQFEIAKAIRAIVKQNWNEAPFERDVCKEARKMHISAGCQDRGEMSFTIPHDVKMKVGRRDYLAGSGEGPELINTATMVSEFIEYLRNNLVLGKLGVRMLTGLTGNVAIPRMATGATAAWMPSEVAGTEQTGVLDTVSLSPNTVNAWSDFSRQLILQAPMAESIVRDDLLGSVAEEIDIGGLRGTGGVQPQGVIGTSGIGDVNFGAAGGPPTNALMVSFITAVANAKALRGRPAWVINPNTFGKLSTTEKVGTTGIFMWNDNKPEAPLYGFPAEITTALRNNLIEGASGAVLSELIFGNWLDAIMGFWGGLDVLVDPFSQSSAGMLRVVVFQSCDFVVRHPGSFCASDELATA